MKTLKWDFGIFVLSFDSSYNILAKNVLDSFFECDSQTLKRFSKSAFH